MIRPKTSVPLFVLSLCYVLYLDCSSVWPFCCIHFLHPDFSCVRYLFSFHPKFFLCQPFLFDLYVIVLYPEFSFVRPLFALCLLWFCIWNDHSLDLCFILMLCFCNQIVPLSDLYFILMLYFCNQIVILTDLCFILMLCFCNQIVPLSDLCFILMLCFLYPDFVCFIWCFVVLYLVYAVRSYVYFICIQIVNLSDLLLYCIRPLSRTIQAWLHFANGKLLFHHYQYSS